MATVWPSCRAVTVALAAADHQRKMLAILFVDLDRFKTIVDTLGHAIGEKLHALAWNRDPREIRTHRRARSAGAHRGPAPTLPVAEGEAGSGTVVP